MENYVGNALEVHSALFLKEMPFKKWIVLENYVGNALEVHSALFLKELPLNNGLLWKIMLCSQCIESYTWLCFVFF